MAVLRRFLAQLISASLALLALLLIFGKLSDFGGGSELLPLGFFAVVLSMAAFAMTWCSNGKTFCSSRDLAELYESSRDLFQSSILALLSSALVALPKMSPWLLSFKSLFYGLHWLMFSLAILLAWWAIQRLLRISARPNLSIEPPR
jgi:hypothetical protein